MPVDELLKFLTTGEVTTTGILLFIIVLLVTGRVVPYWQVSEMKEKLKAYEAKAPDLIETMQELIAIQEEENELTKQDVPYANLKRGPRAIKRTQRSKQRREDR